MNSDTDQPSPPETSEEASRDAMPVADAEAPRLAFPVVGIGASAGGLEAFIEFFDAMPSDRGLAFVLVQHLSPKHESMVAELLQKHTLMPVHQVEDGLEVMPDHVYVIRPGHTMTIKDGRLWLGESLLKPGHSRPVDDFFRSLAEEQRERAICIILSGMGSNGTAGAQAVKVVGGLGIAQEPASAKFTSMPRSMIDANLADFVLKPAEMPDMLLRYTGHAYVHDETPADVLARSEGRQVNDILTILRAATRHDFTGYKRPTLVRRIQRRMSLTQIGSMADYALMLRQTAAEVKNLSDDLMIHVTGFFRDPEVWEGLREKIILPMAAEKPDHASIRVWVTACASGEEAYTLAMLLVEAAEQVDKQFDIKVFATDMAERTLSHARAGIFPGGIESEIHPARLTRFFDKDEGMYRVKKHLRELVVFAPQNVLQDPPFSRLDIVTCRNLLIYLEPDVQSRVLGLLHFGLRDGGTLVLGNSETVGDNDHLFEPIDKKLRLYRRIGLTQQGMINFPGRTSPPAGTGADLDRPLSRASLSQATARTLLEHHSPPSVVVDRHGRIVYYHGETRLFLDQPSGEPTSDLLELAQDFVRGPIRIALHGAVEGAKHAVCKDGAIHIVGVAHRVEVHAMPIEPRSLQGYYLVSFVHYPISQLVVKSEADPDDITGETEGALQAELRALRDELQSTIEELQTSNEEMKASHEEVTSVNEELQSTNEELETSKEELQSLNEELTTVNAQLESKMEELEGTGNDLTSLLSSSDTAVIFLDRQFRIRRFTPATKPLIELLSTDVGRPLTDFARKFHDPELMNAARNVLATLAPEQSTITSDAGRWYVRRVLPYRTTDDRIDGVVLNFIDITEVKRAETALRESEERFRAFVTASSGSIYRMSPDWTEMRGLVGKDFVPTVERPTDSWLDKYIPADERPRVQAAIRGAIETKQPFEMEHRVVRVDGTLGWSFSRAVPLLGPDEAIVEWFGTASDVTARHDAEAAVHASETKYRGLITSIDEGFCIIDLLYDESGRPNDYVYLEANPALERHTGLANVVGQRMCTLVPGLEQAWYDRYGRIAETGEPARFQQAAAAQGRHYDVYAFRIGTPEQRRVAVLFTDITARKTAQTKMQASEGSLQTLLQGALEFAILMMDPAGVITQWSPGATALLGWTEAEAVGRPGAMIFTDNDRAAGAPEYEMRTALRDGRAPDERWHRRRDKSEFWGSGVMSVARDSEGRHRGFVKVLRDVTDRRQADTERKQLLEAEQHARTAAEAANASKDQFLANLGHELRTPLSAMLIWSRLLQEQADPAALAEGLPAIEQSAKAQQKLIDDLLDSARIATGKLSMERRPAELGEVIRDAVATLRPTAEAKGVELNTEIGKTVGVVMADADRLRQVVWNLISNAVKFTPDGGRVDVGVWRRDATIEIRVTDSGVGIDADLLPQIFGRFRQGDTSPTRQQGGLGLGLSISRQIVELHGGTIQAASPGPGRGSVFTVYLPLPRTRATARPPAATQDLAGLRVVLVEDDAQLREVVTMLLQRAGATVDSFASADPAKAAIFADPPDVLLSDIGLPEKDGYALIREIREQEAPAARLPAIAFTAFDRPQDRDRAIECGFDQHLAKPVDPVQLVQAIRALRRS